MLYQNQVVQYQKFIVVTGEETCVEEAFIRLEEGSLTKEAAKPR